MDTSYHYQGKGLFQQGQEVDTGGCNVENDIAVAQLPDDPQVLKDIIEKLGNEIDGLRDRTNTAVNTLFEICDGEDNDCDAVIDNDCDAVIDKMGDPCDTCPEEEK